MKIFRFFSSALLGFGFTLFVVHAADSQIIVRLSNGFGSRFGSDPDRSLFNFGEEGLHVAYGTTGPCGAFDRGHFFSVDNRLKVGVQVTARDGFGDPTYMIYRLNVDGTKLRMTPDTPCGEDDEDDLDESSVHTFDVGNYSIYVGDFDENQMRYDLDFYECQQRTDGCAVFDD